MRRFVIIFGATLVLAVSGSAFAQESCCPQENDDPGPVCMGPSDPFCPATPGSGSGNPGNCQKCDYSPSPIGQVAHCEPARNDDTGRTICDDNWLWAFCNMGGAFCQVITVTP